MQKIMLFTEAEHAADKYTGTILLSIPGDGDEFDDDESEDEGWDDIEDEDFEDLLNDRDDMNEISLDDDELDTDNDDHLPDEDF